jgi:outer membrane protein
MTLDDAIARGIQASHRLAEIDARRDASAAAVDARRAAEKPVVSLQAGYTRTNHVTEFSVPSPAGPPRVLYPDVPDNFRTRVDLQWPIYTGGRTDALERAARAEADAVGQDRAAAQADLKLEITRTYWAVVTARASVRVLADAVASMEGHLRDVRNRLAVGLVPPNDVLSTEAQESRQQMLLIEARNLVESAMTDLRRLTGLAPDAPVEVEATLEPPAPVITLPDVLVDRARAERPERKALEIRTQSAEERERAAAAGRLPSLSVTGGYDYARPNPRIFPRTADWMASWDLSLTMNWALWDGGRTKADVAGASAGRRAVEERLREFDTALPAEIRQRRLDLTSALAGIASANDGVRSATEARRVVSERFENGVANNTDVLDAQLALLQAGLDRTRAIANAQLAAARLDRVLGQ